MGDGPAGGHEVQFTGACQTGAAQAVVVQHFSIE